MALVHNGSNKDEKKGVKALKDFSRAALWYTPVIPPFRSLRQGYIAR
jgi:hypothetical protein